MALFDTNLTLADMRQLLKTGELLQKSRFGQTALHHAIRSNGDIINKISFLVSTEIDVNHQDYTPWRNTALHLALANEFHDPSVHLIKNAGKRIDYSVVDAGGKTPLILAAKINSSTVVQAILEHGEINHAILNLQDSEGMTALHYACLYGNKDMADLLINAGASHLIKNNDGKTPIDCVVAGEARIAATLRSIFINPERDETAKSDFISDQRQQWIRLITSLDPLRIENKKDKIPELMKYESLPFLDLETFVKSGVKKAMSAEDKQRILNRAMNMTGKPLSKAMAESATSLKMYFIERGYFSGFLLRHEAAYGQVDSVAALLTQHSDKIDDAGKQTGQTALHQAAKNNHLNVCALLIARGSDLTSQDADGNTPLHLAIARGHIPLAMYLVEHGAKIHIKNNAKLNPLQICAQKGMHDEKRMLIQSFRAFQQDSITEIPSCSNSI